MANDTDITPFQVVERFYRCLTTGDLDGALTFLHPDVVCSEADSLPYYGGTHRGKQAFVAEVVGVMFERFELEIHDLSVRDGGNVVFVLLDLTFTSRETGKSIRMQAVEVETVVDGLITQLDIYYKDSAAMAAVFPEGVRSA